MKLLFSMLLFATVGRGQQSKLFPVPSSGHCPDGYDVVQECINLGKDGTISDHGQSCSINDPNTFYCSYGKSAPKPLKCGPLQHVEHPYCNVNPSECKDYCADGPALLNSPTLKCGKYEESTFVSTPDEPAFHEGCVPKMHPLTEKEFQELKSEIRALRDWNLSQGQRLERLEKGSK